MSATLTTKAPLASTDLAQGSGRSFSDPTYQAFWLLRLGFFVAPVLFGIDKFFNWMTYWPKYLWMGIPHALHVSPQHFMYAVGAIEITAGVLVLLFPRTAPYVVVAWLAGIIANLVIISAASGHTTYWDIALRDFGLLIGALALGRLAAGVQRKQSPSSDRI